MRLNSIKLMNFRPFKGEQTFVLQTDDLRPVSLIFGSNGSGKTTLLNAFTWALYGSLSEDVEEPERMVTDSVWRSLASGETAVVSVELLFEHEGSDYRLRRQSEVRKESDEQPLSTGRVELWVTSADGSSEPVGAPQERILGILPRGVSRFFFFNGERIEKLVQKGAYSEVQQDIKVLLDLEQVERAIDHLPKVDRRLTADLKKHGGEKASQIQSAIDYLREQEASKREEQKLLEGDLAILTEERDSVTELIRKHASAAPIQKRRDEMAAELKEARDAREGTILERASLIAARGFLAFVEPLLGDTADAAEALYQKGALPSPLKREFVDQLIQEGQCICGTPLTEESSPWKKVKEWRERAGLQAVETAWQQLSGQIPTMKRAREDFREDLQVLVKRVSSARERVSKLEETLSELDGQLKDHPAEDVQQLEHKRISLNGRIADKNQRLGSVKNSLEQTQKEIAQKVQDRSKAEVTDELAAKARTRSDLVQAVRRALEEILTIRSEDMRLRLDSELKDVFSKITIKPYVPRLSEGFELALFQDLDGVELAVPKSTGENQILSLSFVAAVSKLARQIRQERRAEGESMTDAGTYPIVMDAAFGSLDQNYQREVSRALAQMAPQLIVLVSKSQGLGNVVGELMPYVSNLGIIVSYTSLADDVSDDIELGGTSYPYIRSSDADFAELTTVK